MHTLSRAVFAFAALVLMLLALGLILQGVYYAATAIWAPDTHTKTALLNAIGYVVIAIAVFDVAKFLVEEEVVQSREKQTASEARLSLTKFISTIAIAVFLEALVMVFQVGTERVADMLYPTFLLVAGTLLVLGLGVFQRLSAEVEQRVENGGSSGDG
ncbi:MAG TPA: GNAT family acetyltransferase [Beijerinckiaceae bacterium]|nr:GNAT family acetyltransferase [Beijerinckiaceae bacterium]